MLKYLGRLGAAVAAAWLALAPASAGAAGPAWEQWQTIKGIFDVDGPRSDGSLLVAGSAALYLVDAGGNQMPFARGPGGYREDPGTEAYVAVSHGGKVGAAGCSFTPDETFILRLHVPMGITRVTASGEDSGSFANLTGATTLNGLAFDTTGSFDHRLLVSGPNGTKTVIFAVDCAGAVTVLTRSAPQLEGGLAVAPSTFGRFAGDLIAADELSGKIYAIDPAGKATQIAKPALPTGGDIGVESVGFVPAGFLTRGGFAYYADRATANNPHPGSDSILRLSSADLGAAGVREGDMLVATEGGAALLAVRCTNDCSVIPVVTTPTKAHGEGHIAFSVNAPSPSTTPRPAVAHAGGPLVAPGVVDFIGTWGVPIGVAAVLLALVAGLGVRALRRRAR